MNISILGCGWLGFPLAQHLVRNGHNVKGSTTTPGKPEMLGNNNIQPFLIKFSPELGNPVQIQNFWDSEVLVLNIPPGRKRDNVIDYFSTLIHSINNVIINSPIKFVVFISSTSVYPKQPGIVTEGDAVPGKAKSKSGNALLSAEELLSNNSHFKTTVIRFGGLIGYDRHPVKYLAEKKELDRANAPVNLIHRDDCVKIITRIIENNISEEVFNAVNDTHQTRKKFYTEAAKVRDMEPPEFQEDEDKDYKIVSNEKLKTLVNYQFKRNEI